MHIIKTPKTHPDHPIVGHYFKGPCNKKYFCDSYDPSYGYWMTNVDDSSDRTNISERAIGSTFHEFYTINFDTAL